MTLCNYVVISPLQRDKTGPPQHALLFARNSTLQAFTVKSERSSFLSFFPQPSVFFPYYKHQYVESETVAFFFFFFLEQSHKAYLTGAMCQLLVHMSVGQRMNGFYVLYWTDETANNSVSY